MTGNKAPDYVPIEEARHKPGVRIAFTAGVPGPWGIAARAILDLKGIDYVAVAQQAGAPNEALKAWTGQASAPVIMYNDDRPRVLWSEKIVLAEQLKPEPRLIPEDEDGRMEMFGLCHEIGGDDGLGWNVRLLMTSALSAAQQQQFRSLQARYGSHADDAHPRRRVNQILEALGRRLESQAARSSRFLVGNSLTAADIYWAAFSNAFRPMPRELCEMPDFYVALCAAIPSQLDKAPAEILFDHRDHVVRTYFRTPIAF